ncbi:MAG: glycosyltransferase [Acidobacteria bacterium]|nr:glycosyltransferase [Acidobacteriota bacterium]
MNPVRVRAACEEAFAQYMANQKFKHEQGGSLRIDLHCHDANSDTPDELMGRILNVPETWLKTEDLLNCLKRNGAQAFTITNHNNARSCWSLLDKGIDIVPAAEFTCKFPEYQVHFHVLTYGFTPEQEPILNQLRHDAYAFREYTCTHNLPTVIPHPLYVYGANGTLPQAFFEKIALMFPLFEVLNGQRNFLQNYLAWAWVRSLSPQRLEELGKKHQMSPLRFCSDYQRRMCGGSDDHFGLFAGSCGTYISLPEGWQTSGKPTSFWILEALRSGDLAPYGPLADEEKLHVGLLDYFCQLAINMRDPGLVRMFLHKGTLRDKLVALTLSNALQELKRHGYTMRFLRTLADALRGKRPSTLMNWTLRREYKPLLVQVDKLALASRKGPEPLRHAFLEVLPEVYQSLNRIVIDRINDQIQGFAKDRPLRAWWLDFIEHFEVSSHLRSLFSSDSKSEEGSPRLNLGQLFDNLSFPLLASGLIAGSVYATHKTLNQNRAFLNRFASELDIPQHPKVLWLTDTFADQNGVSHTLDEIRAYAAEHGVQLDVLVCHESAAPQQNLIVLEPIETFSLPQFGNQLFRVPDLIQVFNTFREGQYDRLVISTEGFLGMIGLLLKWAFNVPAHFYMHTDWLAYARDAMGSEPEILDRIRRLLRTFYQQFDGIFVLNSEHQNWLASKDMAIPKDRIHKTAHWVHPCFHPGLRQPRLQAQPFSLLYVGRLSSEKGIWELPRLAQALDFAQINYQFNIVGEGPEREKLKQTMPQAHFHGWQPQHELPVFYANADLLVMPSRFDTFGNVILEALACGCPAAAYAQKGPADLIESGTSGILAHDSEQLFSQIIEYSKRPDHQMKLRSGALARAKQFGRARIMHQLLRDLGLPTDQTQVESDETFARVHA